MGWSEPENIYFLSHDIRCVLYLVLYMTTFTLSVLLIACTLRVIPDIEGHSRYRGISLH